MVLPVVQLHYVIKQVVAEVMVCKLPPALILKADSLVVAGQLVTLAAMFQMVDLVVA
jgi:hypothetical protein